jgi:hypothetical protein
MIALLAALLLGGLSVDGDLRLEGRGGPALAGQLTSTGLASADFSVRSGCPALAGQPTSTGSPSADFSVWSGCPALAGQPTSTGSPSADLSVRSGESNLLVLGGIAPQVVVATGSGIAQVFTRAFAALEVRDREAWRFRVRQRVGYGTIDLSPLGSLSAAAVQPTAFPGAQPPPTNKRFVLLGESETTAALEIAVSRRGRLIGDVGWLVSGGADSSARSVLPLSRGPRLHAAVTFQQSRLDELDVDISAFDTRYSNGLRASVAGAMFDWRRTIGRGATVRLGAGPALGRAEAPRVAAAGEDPPAGVNVNVSLLPAVRADVVLEPDAVGERGLSMSLRVGAEPVGDQVSGYLVERGGVSPGVTWVAFPELRLEARATGSVALTSGLSPGQTSRPDTASLGTTRGDLYAQSELRATWSLTLQEDASIGTRWAWLSHPQGLPATQWNLFVSVSFHPFR